jgi:hypothetical protein
MVHNEPPGSDDICPVCFWEDDLSQLRFPEEVGANKVSLIQGQKNYAAIGAKEKRVRKLVRGPLANEQRDPQWRPIDSQRDQYERLLPDVIDTATYPDDHTVLYYWRK